MTRQRKRTTAYAVYIRRGFLTVVAMLTLVGALALIEVARSKSGFGSTSGSTSPLPSAKATVIARSQQAIETAQAGTPPPKPPFVPLPAVPTATFTAGITQDHQGPFSNSDFSVDDEYRGSVNGHWVVIYAGTAWINFPHDGLGALRVYSVDGGLVGVFDAPDGSDNLNITGVSGTTLQIASNKGTQLTFDMATDAFSN